MKLTYPWADPPPHGQITQVADGVLWLRLPLPMALDHVNIYILDDGDGWALVDTGMHWGQVGDLWQQVLDGPLRGKPVTKVISTHHHPDHIGFNGWFMGRGAQLYASRTAYLFGRMLTLDVQEASTPDQIAFYQRAGMRADLLGKRISERPFNFGDIVHPIPLGFAELTDGAEICVGGRRWTVRLGQGHAPDHVTLWSRDDALVLAGDQIIPSISSNIGVFATQPDANPLQDWLQSCEAFKAFARADQLLLPGHKTPFYGAPLRLDQLIENHAGALDRLRTCLQTPHSAGDTMEAIFKRTIRDGEYGLALSEALAHCNYLWHAGEVTRTEIDGTYLWQMVS